MGYLCAVQNTVISVSLMMIVLSKGLTRGLGLPTMLACSIASWPSLTCTWRKCALMTGGEPGAAAIALSRSNVASSGSVSDSLTQGCKIEAVEGSNRDANW